MSFIDIHDAASVSRLLGLLIPLLVALATKKIASSGLKGIVNLVLSAIGGSAAYLIADTGGYDFNGFVNAAINTFVVSIVSYYGVYKPTGVSDTVAVKTSAFGLGKPVLQTDDALDEVEVPVTQPDEDVEAVSDESDVDPQDEVVEPVSEPSTPSPRKRTPRRVRAIADVTVTVVEEKPRLKKRPKDF